jgi:hypothetical protein
MLYEIEILEVRRIAELAAAARDARDRSLTPVPKPNWANRNRHAASTMRPAAWALRASRRMNQRIRRCARQSRPCRRI